MRAPHSEKARVTLGGSATASNMLGCPHSAVSSYPYPNDTASAPASSASSHVFLTVHGIHFGVQCLQPPILA